VKRTTVVKSKFTFQVEDALQNGVKRTSRLNYSILVSVEDAIQNGVKHAKDFVEDIIKDKN
jgi:hypothetical protein